jgi:DNA processing protein
MTVAVDTERWARAWLSRVVEPGQRVVADLIDAVGPVELVHRVRAGDVPASLRRATSVRSLDDRVEQDLAVAAEHDVRLLIPGDPDWPAAALHPCVVATATRKRDLAPPIALWVRGRLDLTPLFERAVAVIGARAATPYGEHCATDLAFGLAERGWTVVSGGAYGIDRAAHRGAVAAGGPTVAFLACGLDAPYPRGNTALFRQIADCGALVSEWPVGTTPQRLRFLARNRLIAAVSAGTVVVEAAARSGTSNTAGQAEKLGRVVMAVPGPTTSALSVGTHHLIREKEARLVTCVDEVIEEVGKIGDDLAPPPRSPANKRDLLDPLARQVLEGLPAHGPATPEHIAAEAAVLPGDVLRAMPILELEGLVERCADGWRLRRGGR